MHAYWQDAGALPLVLDRAGDHKLIGKDRQDRVFSNSFQLCLERPIVYHRQIAIVAAPQGPRSFAPRVILWEFAYFTWSIQLRLLTHCRLSGQEGAVPAWKNRLSNRLAHLSRAEVLQARM